MFDLKTYLAESKIVLGEADANVATAKQIVRFLRDARRGADELIAALKSSGRAYGGLDALVNNLRVIERNAKDTVDTLQQNLQMNPIR